MLHRVTEIPPHAPPAYLANGLIGLRLGPNPMVGTTALVNGFVGRSERIATEAYAPAPCPIGLDLIVGNAILSERPDLVRFRDQQLDFANGELTTRLAFVACDQTVELELLTLLSRTEPTILLQELTLSVATKGSVTVRAQLDPQGLPGQPRERRQLRTLADAVLHWESRGGLGSVAAAYVTEWLGDDLTNRRRNDWGIEEDFQLTDYTVDAVPGKRYRLRQLASLVPSCLHAEPELHVIRLLAKASDIGFDELRASNRQAWAELWRGRPVLHGADNDLQQASDAAFFYLHSTVSRATPCSVAPFGLSQRHYYHGHVFWDTETFMFPPVLLTQPGAARAMLDFRSRQLDGARRNAQLNGYDGLQFPWQVGNVGDEVSTAWSGANPVHEIHISMDVAFAFAQYAHATGDDLFLRQQAWPVLEGVARWLVSRVVRTDRGYEIRHVVGIDEGIHDIHNNAFTNAAAIVILREAMATARRLGMRPPAAWQEIADRLFIPLDEATGGIRKHDAYTYAGGMCVPETLAAFWPYGWSHSPAVDAATVDYHLGLADTYLGMPMLSALLGVYAARRGNRDLARQLFAEGILTHVRQPYWQFNEVSRPHGSAYRTDIEVTCFLTNPAGFLMSVLLGLPNLQLGPDEPSTWRRGPASLPAGWEAIEVERLWLRERPAALTARHGEETCIKWLD